MPLDIRTYHDLTGPDRSGVGEQIGAQRRRVALRLAAVRRVVAVLSGKGGVGKSFVTAGLARALARAGRGVAVLDADLHGPTAARLLDAADVRLALEGDGLRPAVGADGVRVVSMGQLLEEGRPLAFRGAEQDAHLWRGALEAAALREFLADVAWGELDALLVDLPPGTGRFQELADLLSAPPTVLVVTIPTPESRDAVRRAVRFAVERGAPVAGVVENMVGGPFAGDAGDALAREFEIPLLGRVPFHPGAEAWEDLARRIEGRS